MTPDMSSDEPRGGVIRRTLMRHPWAFGITVGLLFFPAIHCFTAGPPKTVPSLGSLPDFQLEDPGGEPVTRASLKGSVWIAHPYVAPCEGPCLATLSAVRDLRARFDEQHLAVQILGWPAAPVRASERHALIERYDAHRAGWRLLEGESIESLVMALQGSETPTPNMTQIVVVGSESHVRGRLGIGSLGVQEATSMVRNLVNEAARRVRARTR